MVSTNRASRFSATIQQSTIARTRCIEIASYNSLLLTSKKWRLQSGCNHSTAYVGQRKG